MAALMHVIAAARPAEPADPIQTLTAMADLLRPLDVLIVDDEALARSRLRTLLQDCVAPPARVVGEADSALAALQWLGQHRCDLLLLDIHLPRMDGLELAARLRALPRAPAVVFVTAYAEHAVTAFEVQAVDYLTKPVRRARLQEALQRALQRLPEAGTAWAGRDGAADAPVPAGPAGGAPGTAEADAVIVVHERGELLRVPLAEVLYVKAELKYLTVRTAGRSHLVEGSLADLEARHGERLLRIHRNALVAPAAVAALELRAEATGDAAAERGAEVWAVYLPAAGEWLAVSRRQLPAVRAALQRG